MSVDNFKPEIWSRELLFQLRSARVLTALTNSNYRGEITQEGDTVRITTPDSVQIRDYSGAVTYDDTSSSQQTMPIDQSRYFGFKVDDVDEAQSNTDLISTFTVEAGEAMADDDDSFVAGLYTDAGNTVGGAGVDKTTVYDTMVDASTQLTKNKVPKQGRVACVSPDFHGLLTKSDEFIKASDLGDATVVEGSVGRIAGFDVLVGHNIITDGSANAVEHNMVGSALAITWAEQIMNIEGLRLESSFSDAVRGLHLYGAKVIRPEALIDVQRNTA